MDRYPPLSTTATASTSRRRHRHDQDEDAIRNGAYLPRPIFPGGASRKGKERALVRSSIIPGLEIGSKGWVREGFRIFGEHCARNQIRTLLIDCLVMTNLFYPALSIYLQKRSLSTRSSYPSHLSAADTRLTPFSSTPLLDTFFPHSPPLLPELEWNGWWDDTGQVVGDEWQLSPGRGQWQGSEVRVMRVAWTDLRSLLDPTRVHDDYSWTDRDYNILDLVRRAAEGWENEYGIEGEGCVRMLETGGTSATFAGDCYIFSQDGIDGTTSITKPAPSRNTSDSRGDDVRNPPSLYRSVAAIIRVGQASSATIDSRWSAAMREISDEVNAELFSETEHHVHRLDVSYRPEGDVKGARPADDPRDIDTWPPRSVLFLYLVLFSVLGHELSNATKVHSQFGLAFTGVTQLCCSTVMSFSVLALLGWNGWGWNTGVERSLPTYVLPFVIVVVGAENMSTLTKAVFSVPFTYSVPVRIGLGLSKVGTTIAITSFTDVVTLLLIWFLVNVRPVREFCLFAAVVIITDWFMLHTFFLTILSIDAQRLELADVLATSDQVETTPRPSADEEQSSAKSGWKKVLRARTSKSGSLLFILATIGCIYYLTERHRLPQGAARLQSIASTIADSMTSATSMPTTGIDLTQLSPGAVFWEAVNPQKLPRIRVTIPAPTTFVLQRAGHLIRSEDLRNLLSSSNRPILSRIKPFIVLFKVLVLPQILTAGALYALLLYLLKDADLLDAQRNRLGRNETQRAHEDGEEGGCPLSGVKINILPCSHESDVEIVASSLDGSVIASLGVDNTLCLWRFDGSPAKGTREVLAREKKDEDDPIIGVSISSDGKCVAALTAAGKIDRWDIGEDDTPTRRDQMIVEDLSPEDIRYVDANVSPDDPFLVRPSSPDIVIRYDLFVVSSNRSVISLKETGERETIVPSRGSPFRTRFVPYMSGAKHKLAILVSTTESTVLYKRLDKTWIPVDIPTPTGSRLVTATIHNDHLAIGFESGLIEVTDLDGTQLVSIGGSSSPTNTQPPTTGIDRLAITTPAFTKCLTCGLESSDCTFIISTSSNDQVRVHRLSSHGTIACRCRRGSTLEEGKFAIASASALPTPPRLVIPPSTSRNGFSPGGSPKRSPSLLGPASNGDFPLSYHGTRRLSALHRDDAPASSGSYGFSTNLNSPDSDIEVSPLGAISTPGSGSCWCVSGDRVIGIRRANGGIDDAQWEIWCLDLRAPWNGKQLVVDTAPMISLLQAAPIIQDNSIRAQRAERLLSLSGRARFPSLGRSISVETFRPMAYTEIRPFLPVEGQAGDENSKCGRVIMGLGNRLGVISIPTTKVVRRMRSSQGGVGLGINGIAVTSPPPTGRRDTLDASKKSL